MKHSLKISLLMLALPSALRAQSSGVEQEVRAFVAEYDKAVAGRNIAFLERVLPDDYVMTGASGRKSDRTQVLKFFTKERDKPSYRMLSLKHENLVVRVSGNMAVVTNDYTSRTTPIAAPNAEPEIANGRHTGVFEKRSGRWMVIAEQDTEQSHDDKVMERQVTKAGQDYNELLKRLGSGRSFVELVGTGDIAARKRVLSDQFVGTSINGEVTGKTQEIDNYQSNRIRLVSSELTEQKVFAIDNNAALETGKVRIVGTNGSTPIDVTTRYTRTWISWGDGWQIVAQHSSLIK